MTILTENEGLNCPSCGDIMTEKHGNYVPTWSNAHDNIVCWTCETKTRTFIENWGFCPHADSMCQECLIEPSQRSCYESELADLTHVTQVAIFGWCSCEDNEGNENPYDDCPPPERLDPIQVFIDDAMRRIWLSERAQ